MKKLIALLLCAVMICACLPTVSFAEDAAETVATEMEEITIGGGGQTEELPAVEDNHEEATDETPSEPEMRAATRTAHPVLTEAEAAAVAEQTWDISEAQDGSITMYLVPNGDETYSLYAFGAGPMQEIPVSLTTDILAKYPWCMESLPVTTAYIGDGITTIGRYLFFNATIESVRIPASVTIIGSFCFQICDALQSINVAEENQNYSSRDGVLYNKEMTEIITVPPGIFGTVEIPYGVTEIPKEAFKCCKNMEGIVIPDSVTSIGQAAFNFAENLKAVYIPASVTSMGRQVFQHCYSLESITVDENNPKYYSDEFGVLYTKDMRELLCFPAALQVSSYTIPNTVKHIWARAFGGNPYISGTITVPSTCEVGFGAFSSCRNLKKVVWKTVPKDTEPYVHENVCPVNQKTISLCAACSINTAINTLTGLTYNKEEWYEESERLHTLGYNSGIGDTGSYGNMREYGEDFFNYYGINFETVSPASTGWKNTIVTALSEGKMIVFNACMERPNSGYGGSGSQHVMCIFGISDEGYLYAYDPSYLDAPMTQFDPELLFNCAYGNTYILSAPTDTTMKAAQISTETAPKVFPDSYTFAASEGEKIGVANGKSTYLAKSSYWAEYQGGTASTTLRFAYEPKATDYIYILDYSESMTRSTVDENYTNMSVEKTLAYESIEELLAADPTARVSVVSFKGLNEAVCSEFTNNASDIYDIIANEKCQGFTCYANGFDAALETINSRTGEDANRKAVVVFATDGNRNVWVNNDDMSYVTYEVDIAAPVSGDTNFGASEAAALRAAGAEIYAVVLNPELSNVAAAKMAEITADEDKIFVAGTIEELGEAFCGVIDAATLRSFTITDTIGNDFNYNGNLVSAEGTTAVIDETNRTITWTLENILPNTEYTLTFDIQCKRNSTGQFVTGDLPTNEGDAEVTEDGETVNTVESPVLHRDPVISTDGAQAHMIHQYADLTRPDNPALYTDGIRFCVTLDMEELQAELDPGDQAAFAITLLPLNKLQNGEKTSYLTMNVAANGKVTSNGSYTFVNHTSAITKSKQLTDATMVTWTQEMEDCSSAATFANLLKNAGVTVFDVTDKGVQVSVYMMFSNAATRQAQADREIAYRGVIVTHNAEDGYVVRYSCQRNNSATRVFNHYNCLNYDVINVDGASEEEMLHGESEYNPAYELQIAAVIE